MHQHVVHSCCRTSPFAYTYLRKEATHQSPVSNLTPPDPLDMAGPSNLGVLKEPGESHNAIAYQPWASLPSGASGFFPLAPPMPSYSDWGFGHGDSTSFQHALANSGHNSALEDEPVEIGVLMPKLP